MSELAARNREPFSNGVYEGNLRDLGYRLCDPISVSTGPQEPGINPKKSSDVLKWLWTHDTREGGKPNLSDEFIIPRWLFAITECRLKANKAIHIRLTRGTELWFAENEQLDVFATGSTTQEAVEEFVLLIIHYFKHYRLLASSNALAEALRLKQLYESSFTEVTQ